MPLEKLPRTYGDAHIVATVNVALGSTIAQMRAGLMQGSIKKSTFQRYLSEVKRMLTFVSTLAEARKHGRQMITVAEISRTTLQDEEAFVHLGNTMTKADFIAYLASHSAVHPIAFGICRAALRFSQIMAGAEPWAADDDIKSAEKGAFSCAMARGLIDSGPPRGTLSQDMTNALIDFVRTKNPRMADAMKIQHGACMRIGELVALRADCITKHGVIIWEQKRDLARQRTSARARATEKKITAWPKGLEAHKDLVRLIVELKLGDDAQIFPRSMFTIEQYNKTIQQAAVFLKWNARVKYDGSHVLRHAGATEAMKHLLHNMALTDISNLLIMSTPMLMHYGLSVEERLSKIRMPAFLKGLALPTDCDEFYPESEESEDEESSEAQTPITTRAVIRSDSDREATAAKRFREVELEAERRRVANARRAAQRFSHVNTTM